MVQDESLNCAADAQQMILLRKGIPGGSLEKNGGCEEGRNRAAPILGESRVGSLKTKGVQAWGCDRRHAGDSAGQAGQSREISGKKHDKIVWQRDRDKNGEDTAWATGVNLGRGWKAVGTAPRARVQNR